MIDVKWPWSFAFFRQLLKECTLTDLMDKEQEIYKQIQALDGEMQTLVYENYNKFISATDTIRKVRASMASTWSFDSVLSELTRSSLKLDEKWL